MIRRVLAFGLLLGCARSSEGVDATRMPETIRADYAVFAQKCSKCHSLARPLNAQVTNDAEWENYVARMRRQPGSAIAPEDTPPILRFLHWYSFESKSPPASPAPAALAEGGAP